MGLRHVEVGGRSSLEGILQQTARGESIVLTRKGRPRAVVLPAYDVEGWEATAEILAQPDALPQIRRSERQIRNGKWKTLDRAFPRRRRRQR